MMKTILSRAVYRPEFRMVRRLAVGLFLTALLFFSGCLVTSIYPYYKPTDVKFDDTLVGTWVDAKKTDSNNETWVFEKLDDRTYKFTIDEGDKKQEFDARLFTLRGVNFLDLLNRERPDYTAAVHLLLRVNALKPNLELRPLNLDWLGKLLEKEPRALRHTVVPKKAGDGETGGDLVLTADTAELQAFLIKHLDTPAAWEGDTSMKRK